MAITRLIRKIVGGAVALTAVMGMASGSARALPTTWILQNAVLDDGGTASGEFTIDTYGFLSTPVGIVTTPGSLLGGFSYTSADPSNILPNSPPATGVEFHSPSYNLTLHIEFAHPLDTSGPDPIILGSSWECAAYTCPGPDTGNPGANTRYFTSGSVVAAPEPAAAAVLGAGLLALGFVRRRR